ncbi:IS66 family transposase [Sphaerochaeta halotolerans]|uniref:IS66 family transposase n=1 Tax=Sphaerochaeta halotolerans TaxID=2293840 RepID=UPI001368514D|nr:IS66 family transposase [Sphaerochaeta halotolerans]MXI86933.1 IS66 family transposase [Sphaerochaeta halotolerans]
MKEHDLTRQMAQELAEVKAENAVLREALDRSNQQVMDLSARLGILDHRAVTNARRKFVTNSERMPKVADPIKESEESIVEDTLLNEAETTTASTVTPISEPYEEEKEPRKKGCGRTALHPDLPRETINVDPSEESLDERFGKGNHHRIGEHCIEILDYTPGSLKVKQYVLGKFASNSSKEAGVLEARMPSDRIIEGGMAGNALVAAALSDKFVYHLPYARQSVRFFNIGLQVSRQNLSRWQIQVTGLLDPLTTLIEQHIMDSAVVHLDETTLQVMGEEGRKNTQKSYIWLRVGTNPLEPAASYRYSPSRAATVAAGLLDGFAGTIQTDGYASYRSVVRDSKGKLRHAGCLVHVRRYLFDVYQATRPKKGTTPGKVNLEAATMLKDIKAIFRVEKKYRSFLKNGKLSEEQFVEQRKAEALLLFDTFHTHLLEASKTVIPKSTFDVAVSYALGQWDILTTYLETPLLSPDNSAAERAVRGVALGRRNWNISGSPAGAASSCAMYTLTQTALLNGLDPGAYLFHVLEKATTLVDLPYTKGPWEALLPWNIDPKDLAWQDRMPLIPREDD